MMKLAVLGLALSFVVHGAISCTPYEDSTPPAGPPCIAVGEGLRFQVSLVETYGPSSNSYYVETVVPNLFNSPYAGSCQAADGLALGSQFEYTTGRYSPAYASGTCSYREMESVTGIGVGAGKYEWAVAGIDGKSFAGWTRTARLAGAPVPYKLLVIAPTGQPFETVVRAQLPPAIVVRYMDNCRDVWVATVQEVAP